MTHPARTYIVPAWVHQSRDDWVNEGADAAGGGLDESLPPYLGVWIDPSEGRPWHVFSDYPESVHSRFGWTR
jgi:hypothetical protein